MDRSDLTLGDLDKSDLLGVYKPVLIEESDLLMVAEDEKDWDIAPGMVLLGALEQDFGSKYSVVVIHQVSLESDFEKSLQKLSMDLDNWQ